MKIEAYRIDARKIDAWKIESRTFARRSLKVPRSLLSLCKRERIKVRDCPGDRILPAHTGLPAGLHRDSRALHHSKSGGRECRPGRETLHAHDLCFDARHAHDRSRRARRRGELPDNRNRECIDRSDADAGICSRSEFGCAVDSRGSARPGWRSCADGRRDSLNRVLGTFGAFGEASLLPPHLNPLPRSGGEETSRASATRARLGQVPPARQAGAWRKGSLLLSRPVVSFRERNFARSAACLEGRR